MVKELPPPAAGAQWVIQLSQGSLIPFVTDGTSRHWCMSMFQQSAAESTEENPSEAMPDLDLDNVVANDPRAKATPVAPLPGVTPRHSVVTIIR